MTKQSAAPSARKKAGRSDTPKPKAASRTRRKTGTIRYDGETPAPEHERPPEGPDADTAGPTGFEIQLLPTAQLATMAAPYNPRRMAPADLAALGRSLRTFGFVEPVVANRRTDRIVGGHQRLSAAQAEGMAVVPVHWIDVDEATEKQLNLALNRIVGTWDEERLSALLRELHAEGADLGLTGFAEDELAALLAAEAKAGHTDPDDAPALGETPVTEPGDVWLLGPHRLICADATDPAALEQLMAGEVADLVVTDPPYNVDLGGKTARLVAAGAATKARREIANDHMSPDAFAAFLVRAMAPWPTHLRPGAALYVFHSHTESGAFKAAALAAGLVVSQFCVWVKHALVMGRQDYQWQHEPCLYGWAPGAGHSWYADRKQTTIWAFDRPTRSDEHPTMKPTALLEYLLRNSSRAEDVVLDPFGGSGSTLIAAERLGRRARLVELEPRYADVIVRRWERFRGLQAEREGTGETFAERAAAAHSGGA